MTKRGLAKHVRRKTRPGEDVDPQQAAEFEARFSKAAEQAAEPAVASGKTGSVRAPAIRKSVPQRGSKKRRATGGKRFVVTLPEEVVRKIHVAAATDGRSLGNVVEAAVTHWFEAGRPDLLSYDT